MTGKKNIVTSWNKGAKPMKPLKRIRYFTMNSWNLSKSLAYNLKIYNVIDKKLQNKVFDLMDVNYFYEDNINPLIYDFDRQFNYEWQAGFNGRSGGYLVLYRGGIQDNRPYCRAGLDIAEDDVPAIVKKAFRQLAINIVKTAEDLAKNYNIAEEVITINKTVKVLKKGA